MTVADRLPPVGATFQHKTDHRIVQIVDAVGGEYGFIRCAGGVNGGGRKFNVSIAGFWKNYAAWPGDAS